VDLVTGHFNKFQHKNRYFFSGNLNNLLQAIGDHPCSKKKSDIDKFPTSGENIPRGTSPHLIDWLSSACRDGLFRGRTDLFWVDVNSLIYDLIKQPADVGQVLAWNYLFNP
jgi:hypothetical protein